MLAEYLASEPETRPQMPALHLDKSRDASTAPRRHCCSNSVCINSVCSLRPNLLCRRAGSPHCIVEPKHQNFMATTFSVLRQKHIRMHALSPFAARFSGTTTACWENSGGRDKISTVIAVPRPTVARRRGFVVSGKLLYCFSRWIRASSVTFWSGCL